ncbi:MAG: MarR family winged helix-turn-helix transcriptional regulator [Hydrogenophaga sp.]|uniref:MarR family winged helix-turn-helix transcriptional regulator n=1 Tax=Hydrogenophaga sp. TaxID=1904254 RepID=UPI002637412B|nr:MarR family winged helix-turn-helix transcriptional regulator [Hydrogenophaga sp.]MDM7943033.1 MarR family winged helix-turn-helix transcriptional regulator [Hydrogenophaga sp.]
MSADNTDTASPALQDFLTWRLHRLAKLTDRHSSDAYAERFALGVGEARCLAAIGQFAPLSIKDLAARANLDKGQASRAAQMLVDRALVLKSASETDARGVVLTLTRTGRTLWKKVMQLIGQRNADIFGCLSSAEQRQLEAVLDRLIAHADQPGQRQGAQ